MPRGLALGNVQVRILVCGVRLRSGRTTYFSAVMESCRRRRGVDSEDAGAIGSRCSSIKSGLIETIQISRLDQTP